MSCVQIEPELIAYHFGTVSPEARLAIEGHLPGCASCVTSYLMLKRELETDDVVPAPSAASRARLRRAVAARVVERHAPAPWQWWQRPFAFGSAAVAVLVAMVLTYRIATRELGAPLSIASRQHTAQLRKV